MERKRYLELCQANSAKPNSVIVYYEDGQYYPVSLRIWFNKKGEIRNTAEIKDYVASAVLHVDITKLSESLEVEE